jgi:hypothetical protein
MTISVAFFISSTGDLIHVPDSHIATVIRDPERFGLTPAEIETVYKKYGERVGVEGEARRELLLKVINHGWLRIRRYPNKYWSVTAASLTPVVQDRLREWAEKMLSGVDGFKELDRYMPVRISSSDGEFGCLIGDLANGSCP